MTDLEEVLKTSSRTGSFCGNTPAEEQAYFETFAQCRSMGEEAARLTRLLRRLSVVRAALGRKAPRHATLP